MKSAIQEAKEKGTNNGLSNSVNPPQTPWTPKFNNNTKFRVRKAKDTTSGFMAGKAGEIMYDKVQHWLTPAKNMNQAIDINLTSDEKDWLEQELSLPKGTLSPYNHAFWAKHFIKIPKDGINIDITQPMDYMNYKLLQKMKEVAFNTTELKSNPEKLYLVESEELEALSVNDKAKIKDEAYKLKFSMTMKDKMDFLKIFRNGKYKVTKAHSEEFVDAKISEIVDSEPEAFSSLLKDRTFKMQVFLQDCVDKRIIVKSTDNKYSVNGEPTPFASSTLDAVLYLENDENSAFLIDLKKRHSL